MRKKQISVILCAAMAVTAIFSGCRKEASAGNMTGNSSYDKFITVDVFDTLANYQGIQSGWFAKTVRIPAPSISAASCSDFGIDSI